jgi:hypothetical protein
MLASSYEYDRKTAAKYGSGNYAQVDAAEFTFVEGGSWHNSK